MDEVKGGPKALQAMFGGSVDVAAGFFELAIQMAAEGRQVKSFLTMLERPGFALVVSPASSRKVSSIEDLRGAAVGVSTPGSASHQLVNYLLARHHVRLQDVRIVRIGLGPTALAAMERGRIDAAVLIGSGLTTIEHRFPTAMLLADTRTSELLCMLVSLEGVLLSTFVLIKQNRMSQRADQRAHLDLQVNLLSEREITKLLQLQRLSGEGDSPSVVLRAKR